MRLALLGTVRCRSTLVLRPRKSENKGHAPPDKKGEVLGASEKVPCGKERGVFCQVNLSEVLFRSVQLKPGSGNWSEFTAKHRKPLLDVPLSPHELSGGTCHYSRSRSFRENESRAVPDSSRGTHTQEQQATSSSMLQSGTKERLRTRTLIPARQSHPIRWRERG